MLREIVYGLLGLLLLLYGADLALGLGDDAREPPRLRARIPLIGHLLGLIQHGVSYYSKTSVRAGGGGGGGQEMYTLGVLHYKLYVCNANRLMPYIQKSARTVSFKPFMQTAVRTHGGASDHAYEIFGDGAFLDDYSHGMKHSLAPGPHLDEQNLRMGNRVMVDIDALLSNTGKGRPGKQFFMLGWVRHAVVQASSCGVYGANRPFVRREVEDAYWKWQSWLPAHMAQLDLFGTGYAARDVVADAYRQYLANMPNDAALVIQERVRVQREAGMSEEDLAKMESGFPTAVFANTSPTLFWTIWELFSRGDVLAEVRREVEERAVTMTTAAEEQRVFELDVGALKHRCPLLLSVYQETQRRRHVHANIRKVLADTVLDDKYLLKAGNYLQMPGAPIHDSEAIWGPTAGDFDPYRFVDHGGSSSGSHNKTGTTPAPGNSAFLAWGAPPHLCPARQFASTEILIIVALLALRADLRPVDGGRGSWEYPELNRADMVTVLNPKEDVRMEVVAREEWSGHWLLKTSESTSRISLASG
ncbi:hypothetical protein PFICI_04475 [Pestalotiopsis fici W106-1]|uniref:Cytochrome P450 n=1 Tax=Pestalotiopsis fici (strain W106-1 / CGMCC3.15140) TaxID=1229662 RepID=W3X987_PESFW|nr:uncharacterized protein PFICI_04475 [Pestalotiopsis fici W106-1]ETS82599.1 hypothetical protein PFICI_04475 [Pestalotiopsis fici W106-1]